MRAEDEAEERLRQLVMLRVGVRSVFGDRMCSHGGRERGVDIARRHCHPPMRTTDQVGDAEAGHGVGERQALDQTSCCRDHAHARNS